ncbi:uncharacterized protein LOC129349591 [Amphiprion ocellaris]|uniref:uncharacterized protein LOC129349591 n=1 Tax=Amphiprion ocellaris TaxID=80972 RepID=UPI002411141D|nr:uncharacterized protein LOC129349591 [Amphiprion ocellaris]
MMSGTGMEETVGLNVEKNKRVVKSTQKGLEHNLQLRISSRKAILGQLTEKRSELHALMDDDANVENIKGELLTKYEGLINKLSEINVHVKDLFCQIGCEENMNTDQRDWYEPRISQHLNFVKDVNVWIQAAKLRQEESKRISDELKPEDSVSVTSKKSKRSKCVSSASTSSAHSERLKIELERAALLAKTAALKRKQALEEQELQLKAEKEELELQAGLDAADARLAVLRQYEGSEVSSRTKGSKVDVLTSAPLKHVSHSEGGVVSGGSQHSHVGRRDAGDHMIQAPVYSVDNFVPPDNLVTVMQRQNYITESLIKQQKLSTLPPQNIPVFKGDPTEYCLFIRAFEHGVESKTEDCKDRLYYLEQHTNGQPNNIVRSCFHMDPEQGYWEAKRLLRERFGDKYKISMAYLDKALNWPVIKTDDAKALDSYALFLTSCCNVMSELEYLEEMENAANMRAIVAKLPYRLRERFRSVAIDIQKRQDRRTKFKDVVAFINAQAEMASHPVFGEIPGQTRRQSDSKTERSSGKKNVTILATEIRPQKSEKGADIGNKKTQEKRTQVNKAFNKPCIFCQGDHIMEQCKRLQRMLHKEKLEFLKSKGLCFSCLTAGHMSKVCEEKKSCQICSATHPTLLHIKQKPKNLPKEEASEGDSESESQREEQTVVSGFVDAGDTSSQTGAGGTDSILAIVPVRVKAKKGSKVLTCYAFLDPGSNASFCTNKLANDLHLQGKNVNILLTTMGEQKAVSCKAVPDLEVSSLEDDNFIELTEVFAQKAIPVSKENIPTQEDVDKWPHLRGVQIPLINADVGLLIGTNVVKALEPEEVIRSVKDGPYAVRTALGWTINGPLRENIRRRTKHGYPLIKTNRISVARLEELWTQQFKCDFPENAQGECLEMSKDDQLFMDRVSESAKLVDGHYSIGLPLKNNDVKMPNNKVVAEQRALNLKKKLQRNQTFKEDYVNFMNKVINMGYAVKVPDEELNRSDGKVWFIPHHGVYHPKKQKIRVVFDCGVSYQGATLNGQLLQGPDLTSSLIGVLTRFRLEQVAVMADVESMFHQVQVPPEDADLLRFLWWPEGDVSQELQEYRMQVHLFGATSSPSCASYALKRCAEDNKDRFDAVAVDTVLHNFYVDDCLKSVASEQEAVKLHQDLTAICQAGGFRLTKWMTNSQNVLSSIPPEDRATEVKDLDLDQDALPIERALGVQWCIQSDEFKFHVNIQLKPLTRRGILSMMSSIYDPLGMLSPVILLARNILQELCRLRTGWDDAVPDHLGQQWSRWMEELQHLTDFGLERCFKPPEFGATVEAQLHHFSDASETGYGTVTYLVQKSISNQIHCSFVLGKARVAPLKSTTIPRLELTAAALAVKVDVMLKKELQLPLRESKFWTDSTAVLKYIANENIRFKTFVANRIATILQASRVKQWRYINTQLNPADFASRGQRANIFIHNKVWISGPAFLSKSELEWPDNLGHQEELTVTDPEVKKSILVNATTVKESSDGMQRLTEYFSSWIRLKKTVAWFTRVKGILLNLSRKRKELCEVYKDQVQMNKEMANYKKSLKQTYLTVDDLRQAELDIIRYCQQIKFQEEISALQRKETVKKGSRIYKLNPQLQEGILRVGGRLSRACMPTEAKHPMLLPKDHHVVDLILQDAHELLGHSGRNHVLSHIRQRYWIIDAPVTIRKILSRCAACRRQHGAPGTQMMADLPRNRVVPDEPPFTRSGVDLFGPFDVKRGRSSVKRYGVLFTCLTSRAVHIEMATSLDTDSFIHALRRFIARRGQVKEMRSDNGTNFVGADRELKKAIKEWNTSQIEDSLLQRDIRWMFNPPSGSHHGGVWERIIRSIRKIMTATLREQSLDEEGLQTFFCECEAILNTRPLTTPSNDIDDLEALTPQHLLLLKTQPDLPPGLFKKDDIYVRRRWRQVQYMSDLFWKRWTKEYLPQLQARQKWNYPSRNFIPGDVVLIVDDSAPRGSWLMGRIIKTIEDEHGMVRKVRVKTKTNELERPITKLCLLQEAT